MFNFLKRNKTVKVPDEPIQLMEAKTAREVYLNKLKEIQDKQWSQAHAAIPQIAKMIAKESANGNYKVTYSVSDEAVSKKISSILKGKGYTTWSRYGCGDIEISW